MKRLMLVVVAVLVFAGSAWASATVYSGVASSNRVLSFSHAKLVPGSISATASFAPKRNGTYALWLGLDADGNGTFSDPGDRACFRISNKDNPTSSLTCSFPDAPAGRYEVEFETLNGSVAVQIVVTE